MQDSSLDQVFRRRPGPNRLAAVVAAGVALATTAGLTACGSHAASPRATATTAPAEDERLAPLRPLLARLERAETAFDAVYRQTAPDGTVTEYRLTRDGPRARFENTAFGQHVVVITDGTRTWRCTGPEGQPVTRCEPDDTNFDSRYDPRLAVTMLPKLLGIGGDALSVHTSTDVVAGQPVDCSTFEQPRPGRTLRGRVCVTADGVLALDDFGARLELASLARAVDAAVFTPPAG